MMMLHKASGPGSIRWATALALKRFLGPFDSALVRCSGVLRHLRDVTFAELELFAQTVTVSFGSAGAGAIHEPLTATPGLMSLAALLPHRRAAWPTRQPEYRPKPGPRRGCASRTALQKLKFTSAPRR